MAENYYVEAFQAHEALQGQSPINETAPDYFGEDTKDRRPLQTEPISHET